MQKNLICKFCSSSVSIETGIVGIATSLFCHCTNKKESYSYLILPEHKSLRSERNAFKIDKNIHKINNVIRHTKVEDFALNNMFMLSQQAPRPTTGLKNG